MHFEEHCGSENDAEAKNNQSEINRNTEKQLILDYGCQILKTIRETKHGEIQFVVHMSV